jgi:hypothetical protein
MTRYTTGLAALAAVMLLVRPAASADEGKWSWDKDTRPAPGPAVPASGDKGCEAGAPDKAPDGSCVKPPASEQPLEDILAPPAAASIQASQRPARKTQ